MKLCAIHRWVASYAQDDGRPLPVWTARHVAACGECRRVLEGQARLVQRLGETANAERLPAPPFLRPRVLANLTPSQVRPGLRWPGWAGPAVAVGVAVCAAVGFWLRPDPATAPRAGSPVGAGLVGGWSDSWLGEVSVPAGGPLVGLSEALEDPLSKEIDRVVNDARAVMAALSRSFLPDPGSTSGRTAVQ